MRQAQIQSPEAHYLFQVDNSDLINSLCVRIAQSRMNQLLLLFLHPIYKHIMKELNVRLNLSCVE